ncbi:MAG: matrixin family metalloprotease [Anaerolineales bacterium]|nr:matrixin family metalloprotease [Anaerolineales bacterium]
MINFKFKIFLLLYILVLIFLGPVRKTQAYVYAGCKWPTNTMYYDRSALSTAWRNAVSFGREQWNNVNPSPFSILIDDASQNDVTLGTLPSSQAGYTYRHCIGTTITEADIIFNSTYSWYTGENSPGGLWDARSVATHEFGHAIGLKHTQNSNCPSNDALKATMCDGYNAGKTYFRTLESDDKSGINNTYP